eukprot:Gb_01217 [translate_table: standard]
MVKSAHVKNTSQKSHQFKGIRMRKWGKWVSEIRMPNSRAKIWLGSYETPEKAARAYDAAVYCLRGSTAKFNFPDSLPDIPSASSLSSAEIQAAAARFALEGFSSVSRKEVTQPLTRSPSPSSSSSSASQVEYSSIDSLHIPEERDWAFWDFVLEDCQSSHSLNLESFPSLDMSLLDLPFPSPAKQHGHFLRQQTELWSF